MNSTYQKRRRLLIDRRQWRGLMPVTGTQRRLRALAAIGWSWASLAAECGMDERSLQRLAGAERPTVQAKTHDRIAGLYERLSMTVGPNDAARMYAQRQGWPAPLAWDEIDDPGAQPVDGHEHGTRKAYDAHRGRGEKPCADCRKAAAAWSAARRERRAA